MSVINPRYYQSGAVEATIAWFESGKQKPLIVLPTGTGKSFVQALLIQTILTGHNYVRIICATHSKELVQQNHDEVLEVWPECPAGIYSAGLGKRQSKAQVLFAGIQSVYKKTNEIGAADIIIVDEAHTMSPEDETRWNIFIADQLAYNPDLQIIGMTATPYREDNGNLVPKVFDGIVYEYSVAQAIKDGYLCDVVSAPTATHLSTKGVKKRGHDFAAGELERAVNKEHLVKACCEEMIALGQDRKSWLVFASGNQHAKDINDYLLSRGVDSVCLTKNTPKEERRLAIQRHKSGHLKCIVNNLILTTGYNNPRLDMIACMRPTKSKSLWVQIVGRLMRLFKDKINGLLLDFGRNLDRHGPIDKIRGDSKDSPSCDGEAPMKQCPKCYAPVYAAARICPECEHEFDMEIAPNIDHKPSDSVVFSTQEKPIELDVMGFKARRHMGKDGKPDSLCVSYATTVGAIKEFVFFDHPEGWRPRKEAILWAVKHGHDFNSGPIGGVSWAEGKQWNVPISIKVQKEKKYFKIKEKTFDTDKNI